MFRVCLPIVVAFLLISFTVAQTTDPGAATQETGFGVITGNSVRLRGGPGDSYAEIQRKNRGDLVRIVGRSGDWVEVQVPGGFPAYVKKGSSSQPYLEIKAPGEALVLVDRLQLRPLPTTDQISIGVLKPNQILVLLNEVKGDWYRVVAPRTETLFVYNTFVKLGDDQSVLKDDYARVAAMESNNLLKDGVLSRKAMKRWAEVEKWQKRLEAADAKLVKTESAKPDTKLLSDLRAEYGVIASGAPKGCEVVARAEGRTAQLDRRLEMASVIEKANTRIKELEQQSKKTDSDYEKALAAYRSEAQTRPATPKSRFLAFGIGNLRKDILSEFKDYTVYTLTKGGKRLHFLVSDRYDLDHYLNKTIGVVESEVITDDGEGPRTIRVTRIEVL